MDLKETNISLTTNSTTKELLGFIASRAMPHFQGKSYSLGAEATVRLMC